MERTYGNKGQTWAMILNITQYKLYKKILDDQNIFNAIFCMESYIFDKGLLNTDNPVEFFDKSGEVIDVIAKMIWSYIMRSQTNIILS